MEESTRARNERAEEEARSNPWEIDAPFLGGPELLQELT